MILNNATFYYGRASFMRVLTGCATSATSPLTLRRGLLSLFIALGILSPISAFAQTGNCRLIHIDYHHRRALQAVEALFTTPYLLSSYRYVPASSAQRQRGQSEAARIAPEIVAQNPDVVLVHGSTFTGSANLRAVLGEFISSIDRAKGSIRGFVVYSSAKLDKAALSIDGSLRGELRFMYAPIVNRFRPPDESAEVLKKHVQELCGI